MSETGYATLVIDIIESKGGIDYVVGTYTASTESNGMDVTNKHDERLKKVLQECFTNYMKTSDNDKIAMVFSVEQNIKSKTITAIPAKGIYMTYADVPNDMPLDYNNFEIINKNERFYLLNKTTNSEELNYYRFSDGENFYINVSKYAILY
ncbi:MAG: hypothetical protein RL619_1142 [Bacteroidota bacterium]|jgi:hypothetical protein